MTHLTLTVSAKDYEDADDCLAAAARDVAGDLDLVGYDLSPRWADEDRDAIALDIPAHAVPRAHMLGYV